MSPVAFHVFERPVFWYGILAAAGFMAGLFHWTCLAKRAGQPAERASDLALSAMVGGLVGARLAYIFSNFSYFKSRPLEWIRVDHGGLVFYGGVFGAVAAVLFLAHRKRTPLWPLGDYAVSALPLGHAFGRVGCFLNGCCHGFPATRGWPSIGYPADSAAGDLYGSLAVHPVQLYEAGANLLLYLLLLSFWFRPHRPRPGILVALYAAGYGAIRFGTEFLRGDERLRTGGLTTAQWASLVLLAGAPLLFRWVSASKPRTPPKKAGSP